MGSRSRKRRRAGANAGAAPTAGASPPPTAAAPAPAGASPPPAARPPAAAASPPPAAAAASPVADPAAPPRAAPASDEVDPLRRRYARGRARDEAVRQGLEPLAPGERPGAVTIAAIVAFVFAVANVVATLTVGELSSDNGDPTVFAVVTTSILVLAGAGMLARRYWAVLGFQVILGLQIVVFSLALLRVQKLWLGILMTIAIVLLGLLFWKLIRAMARLQMPDRGPATR
jgi:hypothetical protein